MFYIYFGTFYSSLYDQCWKPKIDRFGLDLSQLWIKNFKTINPRTMFSTINSYKSSFKSKKFQQSGIYWGSHVTPSYEYIYQYRLEFSVKAEIKPGILHVVGKIDWKVTKTPRWDLGGEETEFVKGIFDLKSRTMCVAGYRASL